LNRFLIKDLCHKLNLLYHLPLPSIIDDKILSPPLFQPRVEKFFRPPTSSLNPHLQNISTPTSILTIRSLLKGIIASQLVAYFDADDLLPAHQSGFRRNHSTETLLVRLLSDLHGAMDAGHVSLLALFDVNSAFDSVDRSILFQRLSTSFGLTDKPLEWFRFFLSEHTYCATFGSSRSAWVHAPFGIHQGSFLGLLLHIIYTADIGAMLSSHGLLHQLYADDVQAYTHCPSDCAVTMVRQLCL